ncbi:IS3 family transposase [Candidatus Poriferisodalis sp.]|uniref:IS3 family transposase n=1 Tax=Candidatus Poriferisodalis sp. TaxID=3101277 RepID=UPI003AF5B1D3
MAPRGYPAEFRRRVIDLVESGRRVAAVASELGISGQSIYAWRRQARIDAGVEPGMSTAEHAELVVLRKRVRELETELAIHAGRLSWVGGRRPKRRFAAIKVMAAEGLPVERACALLGVSVSGYYGWLGRPRSARSIRHAWLSGVIGEVHADSRQTYGAIRVHAELTLGRGIAVCRQTVETLMRQAGLRGVSGRPTHRKVPNMATVSDLVDRDFARAEPDRLWVTDITEHPTREGKVFCAVVLDTFSRRVVGWSIDSRPTASLAANALGMAIDNRRPTVGETVIHSDQGTQAGFNWSSQHRVVGGSVGAR